MFKITHQNLVDINLYVSPKLLGGSELSKAIEELKQDGIQVVVSLLSRHQVQQAALQNESVACRQAQIAFYHYPITDYGVPDNMAAFKKKVATVLCHLKAGERVMLHCWAGIGRSGLLACALLFELGVPEDEIFSTVSDARGCTVPENNLQKQWLTRYFKRY